MPDEAFFAELLHEQSGNDPISCRLSYAQEEHLGALILLVLALDHSTGRCNLSSPSNRIDGKTVLLTPAPSSSTLLWT